MYVGDTGTIIRVDTNIDLTGMTESDTVLRVKKPSGAIEEWDCEIEGSPIDGILWHEIQSGDLDESGKYLLQAYVAFDPDHHLGTTANFTVYAEWK